MISYISLVWCNDILKLNEMLLHMYFVIEMIKSCLALTWFVLWNDNTPSEAWFSDDKNMMCLYYHLRIVSPYLSIQTLISEWSEDLSRENGLGCLVGCPTGRGPVKGSLEADISAIILEWGFFLLETHEHRIPSEESPRLWSWKENYSIGNESSVGQWQLPNWGWALGTQRYVFAL